MKKMINKPEDIVEEMVSGMLKAYPEYLERVKDLPVIVRKNKKVGKVALVSGGGSGHEPSHAGFVGCGMLDGAVAGEVFTSPSADKVYEAIKAVNNGAGVLLIIKNYSGDVMNFEMAAEMAAMEGIEVKKIVVDDDIAVENSTYTVGRRGIAGTVLVHKMVGAAAEKGYSLEELEVLGNKVITRTKTLGMALEPCMVPTTGKLSFELADDEVEIGLGIHGEPGTHREKIQPANVHVDYILEKIFKESDLKENDEVVLLVNGLGETTLMELFIINNRVAQVLEEKNIKVIAHGLPHPLHHAGLRRYNGERVFPGTIRLCRIPDEEPHLLGNHRYLRHIHPRRNSCLYHPPAPAHPARTQRPLPAAGRRGPCRIPGAHPATGRTAEHGKTAEKPGCFPLRHPRQTRKNLLRTREYIIATSSHVSGSKTDNHRLLGKQ